MIRPANRSIPDCGIIPELAYRDVGDAVQWLGEKFGFTLRLRIGNHRAQLLFEGGAIVVTARPAPTGDSPIEQHHSVLVRVCDIHRHYARAVNTGVKIIRPIADHPYGERQYSAEDFGGHVWTFSQTIADSDPATWGGELVGR